MRPSTPSTLWNLLSAEQQLAVLESCLFVIDDWSHDRDGWVRGLVGPAGLGGSTGTFAVNLTTGEVEDRKAHGYTGGIVDVIQHAHGLTRREAEEWLATQADR